MSIENCDKSLWDKVMDAKDPLNWVLLGFPAGEKKKVEVVGSGTGGRAELVSNFKDDQVMYGGFVVYGVDDRGGVQSRRGKFCFVCYVGPVRRVPSSCHCALVVVVVVVFFLALRQGLSSILTCVIAVRLFVLLFV